jgi:hypothetical protein
VLLEELYGEEKQIVEVEGVVVLQLFLIERIDLRKLFVVADEFFRFDKGVFGLGDLSAERAQLSLFLFDVEGDEAFFEHFFAILFVVDHKVAGIPKRRDRLAQNARAEAVERARQYRLVGQVQDPMAHLGGGFIGKGDSQDFCRGDAQLQQVGYAVGDDARLAGPGPRKDEKRPFDMVDSDLLVRIKIFHT